MGYDVMLYRAETKVKHAATKSEDFFEDENNLIPFNNEQIGYLKQRLIKYGYTVERDASKELVFAFKDKSIRVLLTTTCLYFSATGEDIFEISMTASEFTDTGEFKKYDPQDGGWEEI